MLHVNRARIPTLAWVFLAVACAETAPPRALTPRELGNVTAFANALGYIRFFHPTDAAVGVNWDAFAVRGIRTIASATSDDSLVAALSTVFAPITSNVRFARTGAPLPTTVPTPDDATHVVFWRHLGVGSPSGGGAPAAGPYRSERVVAPLSEIGHSIAFQGEDPVVSLPPVPDPSHPIVVALGGGVSMSMPIALFTHAEVVEEALRVPNPSGVVERFTGNDRATRLADVALAWSLFKHFYPYFDVVRTDWPAALDTALRSAGTDVDGVAFQATLDRLLAALHDGHAFIRPSPLPSTPDVRFGWAEGRVLVTAIGRSAAASGLAVGDEVISVEGRPIETYLAERTARISGATPQYIRSLALQNLLVGSPHSRAQLGIRAASGATRDVSLSRDVSVSEAPKVAVNPKVDSIAEVAPGVLYVDLCRNTAAIADSLPRVQRATAVIFDMRGRTRWGTGKLLSHFSDTLIHSPRIMIPVITLPNYQHVGFIDGSWTIAPAPPRLSARLVFLSDGGAISHEETLLAMVEENRLGDIVGEPSAGTNGVVNPFTLPGGYDVYWTGELVQKRDGSRHHGVGVIPTVPVSPTVAGIRAGRDEVLERAISLVTARGGQ